MKRIICPRCSGHGKIEKYNHVEAGICFKCNGSGKIEVEDHVKDIIAEIREERKNSKGIEKEYQITYEPLKNEIKQDKDWYWYITNAQGTEETTMHEERLLRLKQYIEFKAEWKVYISNYMELIDDIEEYKRVRAEIENRYLNSRE